MRCREVQPSRGDRRIRQSRTSDWVASEGAWRLSYCVVVRARLQWLKRYGEALSFGRVPFPCCSPSSRGGTGGRLGQGAPAGSGRPPWPLSAAWGPWRAWRPRAGRQVVLSRGLGFERHCLRGNRASLKKEFMALNQQKVARLETHTFLRAPQ